MNSGIYAIKNNINGKMYIGRSNDLERRKKEHKTLLNCNKHHNRHLQFAINKYGYNNFDFITLEICSDEICGEREIFYIEKHNSFKKGYNQTMGGDGGHFGMRFDEAYKRRLSEILKSKNIKLSDEHKQKLSTSKRDMWKNTEYRNKMIEVFKKCHTGLTRSEETKSKMVMNCSKRKVSEKDVIDIRLRHLKGERQRDILLDYPITRATISKICLGQTFKNIPIIIEELEKLKEAK